MDIYKEEVMDHYEHPRNQGSFGDAPAKGGQAGQVIEGKDANASCGDMVQFQIRVKKVPNSGTSESSELEIIDEVKWKGIGCAITTASASKLSEYLKGQALKVVQEMSEEELLKTGVGFEVNPGREKCLTLPVKVVKKLLES